MQNVFWQGTRVRLIKKENEMATEKVTAANFNEVVLKSTTPVLVDFWAEWCGPCRAVAPILEEISTEYDGKIKIVKLNTDEEGSVAMKYGISSIPTMNLFVGGEVVKSIVGARPKPAIVRELSEYIG
jgi:thioredoxin 1